MYKNGLIDVTLPVGSIIVFAGKMQAFQDGLQPEKFVTCPEWFGWKICDGSSLKAAEYPELYAVLGGLYGTSGSDGELMFSLPDLSGQFLRGVGTDACSTDDRKPAANGESNGVGSTQGDAFQSHQHQYTEPVGTATAGDAGKSDLATASGYTGGPVQGTGTNAIKTSSAETRPTNTFVYYIIKYTYKLPHFQSYLFPAL